MAWWYWPSYWGSYGPWPWLWWWGWGRGRGWCWLLLPWLMGWYGYGGSWPPIYGYGWPIPKSERDALLREKEWLEGRLREIEGRLRELEGGGG